MSKVLVTGAALEQYKALYPNDEKLQKLTLDELLTATAGMTVDFSSITYEGRSPALLGDGWSCAEAVGYVVFRLCLLVPWSCNAAFLTDC